jgi:hypothetical protein
MHPPVFVSYRRDDSAAEAQFIVLLLRKVLGAESVFCDVSSITPGQAWPARIELELDRAATVVAVIGPAWLTSADQWGRRRIDKPDDWVRCELERALNSGKEVVPVLLQGARLPPPDALPPVLRALTERQHIDVRRDYQEHDLGLLLNQFTAESRPVPVLSEGLAGAISEQIAATETRNLRFRSPHLLRALLSLEPSLTEDCLNAVQSGYAARVGKMLDTFFARQSENANEHGFIPFVAASLPAIRAAADLAEKEGSATIEERHVLLAFLNSGTGLAETIRRDLGEAAYFRLQQIAMERRWGPASCTPISLYQPGDPDGK